MAGQASIGNEPVDLSLPVDHVVGFYLVPFKDGADTFQPVGAGGVGCGITDGVEHDIADVLFPSWPEGPGNEASRGRLNFWGIAVVQGR